MANGRNDKEDDLDEIRNISWEENGDLVDALSGSDIEVLLEFISRELKANIRKIKRVYSVYNCQCLWFIRMIP